MLRSAVKATRTIHTINILIVVTGLAKTFRHGNLSLAVGAYTARLMLDVCICAHPSVFSQKTAARIAQPLSFFANNENGSAVDAASCMSVWM